MRRCLSSHMFFVVVLVLVPAPLLLVSFIASSTALQIADSYSCLFWSQVPAWMKLPAFYLLDAISKNVYDPYARHFSTIVVRLFIDTYEQVDPNTQSKMIEMLTTWRNGAPNGKELFGVVNQLALERHIWPDDASRNVAVSTPTQRRRRPNRRPWHRQSSSRLQNGAPSISTPQVLGELEFVLSQKERAAQSNPYDKQAHSHVTILHQVRPLPVDYSNKSLSGGHQLRKLVQAGVSQQELGQILTQLRTLSQPPPPAPVVPSMPPAAAMPPPPPPPQYARPSFPPQNNYHAAPAPQNPSYPYPTPLPPHQVYHQPKLEPAPEPASAPTAPAVPPVESITNIYNALLKAGVLSGSSSNTPTGAGATAKEGTPQPAPQSMNTVDLVKEADQQYRKAILAVQMKLSSTDIIR